jgi:ATP-dependent Clp protease ATP-binding subunit ClpB
LGVVCEDVKTKGSGWTSPLFEKIKLELSKGALVYLAERGYDPVFGARPLKRLIQHDLVDKMALKLLDGEIKEGQTVKVDTSKGGELVIK